MKKIFIFSLFFLAFVLLLEPVVFADVIMPGTHAVNTCAKIVNLDKFSNIVLISYITGPLAEGDMTSQIENNKCLNKGYKFNQLSIYWNTKEKGISINPDNLLLENAPVYGGYVDNKNPLVKEDIEYSIAEISDGKFILYKSKQTSEYNNGAPKKVDVFQSPQQAETTPNPIPTPSPEPIKRGLWQSIICFFAKLFGSGCE